MTIEEALAQVVYEHGFSSGCDRCHDCKDSLEVLAAAYHSQRAALEKARDFATRASDRVWCRMGCNECGEAKEQADDVLATIREALGEKA